MYRPVEQMSLYEVKDQLGSVRAVVGGRSQESFLATAESERAGSGAEPYNEEDYFTDIKRVSGPPHLNHTPDNIVAGADEAIRINNNQDGTLQPIGTALMREVFAGDTLSAEAFVKYEHFEGERPPLGGLSVFLAAALGVPASGEGAFLQEGSLSIVEMMEAAVARAPEDNLPQAGLGYLLFDRDLQVVDQGWANVSRQARIPQDTSALNGHLFERLALENVPVQEAGFVYFFVANYDRKNVSTFFDDFAVEHSTTGVLYAADHMPFGMKMSGRTIERTDYRRGFQGEWSEEEEETGELAFQLRMYSPVLGRWLSVDPKRQHFSPYLSMGNNPINKIDMDGGDDTYYNRDGSMRYSVERGWLFELLHGGDRNFIYGQSGDKYRLTDQGLNVLQSDGYEGFWEDWQTSSADLGFKSRVEAAVSGYSSDKSLLSYIIYESQDQPGRLMNQKTQLNPNMLYGFDRGAYNVNEAGNLVWGGAMAVFGNPSLYTYMFAHGGTLMAKQRFDELSESNATRIGASYLNGPLSGFRDATRRSVGFSPWNHRPKGTYQYGY